MRIFGLDEKVSDPAAVESGFRPGPYRALSPHGALVPSPPAQARYIFSGWTLDATTRDLSGAAGRRAELTSSEFDLLMALLRCPGQAISRADLVRALRGRDWNYFDRSIDTLVARLRKKIDTPGAPSLVRSARGVGYVLCASVAREAAVDS